MDGTRGTSMSLQPAEELLTLATDAYAQGRYEELTAMTDDLVGAVVRTADPLVKANLHRIIAISKVQTRDYVGALERHHLALRLFESVDDVRGIGGSYINIGVCHSRLGAESKAIDYFVRGIDVLDGSEHTTFIVNGKMNLGVSYSKTDRLVEAAEQFEFAVSWFEDHKMWGPLSNALSNLASVYDLLGRQDEVLAIAKRLQALADEHDVKLAAYQSRMLAATEYQHRREWDVALRLIDEAREIQRTISSDPSIHTDIIRARALRYLGRIEEAQDVYENICVIASQLHEHDTLASAQKDYAELLAERGMFDKAYALLKDHLSNGTSDDLRKAALEMHRFEAQEIERRFRERLHTAQEQERVLHNTLPSSVAHALVTDGHYAPERYNDVSVLFADIVGFTPMSSQLDPADLIDGLTNVFETFDDIAARYGLEKIKTVGDAWMAVCGAPVYVDDHVIRIAEAALDMQRAVRTMVFPGADSVVKLRIGIHSGPVVAGVIGKSRLAFDVWGDTVNLAARLEQTAQHGSIHVSEAITSRLGNDSGQRFRFSEGRVVDIKGFGSITTYELREGEGRQGARSRRIKD